jgi:hypothetical protein
MINWFKSLSPGRKFVIVWNAILIPVVVPVLIYILFFSGEPLPMNPFAILGLMTVFAIFGGIIAWRRFR